MTHLRQGAKPYKEVDLLSYLSRTGRISKLEFSEAEVPRGYRQLSGPFGFRLHPNAGSATMSFDRKMGVTNHQTMCEKHELMKAVSFGLHTRVGAAIKDSFVAFQCSGP